MHRFLLALVLLFSFSLYAKNETPQVATEVTGQLLYPDDPYSMQFRFTSGSKNFAGQIIEVDRFRPAVLLDQTPEYIEFANYFHDNRYWIARLKLNAETAVGYAQIVNFAAVPGVTAAHTQYRVVFKAGSEIELRSQRAGATETMLVNDIIISSEAARPAGFPYDFAKGLYENFAVMKRPVSGLQRAHESTGNIIEQYVLNLSSAQLVQMVVNSVLEGDQEKASRFYGTLFPNCTTDLFASIDKVLPGQKPEPFMTVLSPDPISAPTKQALAKRGILGKRGPNLDRELFNGETEYTPTPEELKPKTGIFPERMAEKFSLVVHVPNEGALSAAEKAVVDAAKKKLYVLVSEVIQTSTSTGSLNNAEAQSLFVTGLRKVGAALKVFVDEVDATLPEGTDSKILVYFTPFVGAPQDEITEEILGDLPARLPFHTYRARVDGVVDDLYQVQSGPRQVRLAFYEETQRKGLAAKPFELNSVTLQLRLKKGASFARVQIAGGLNPLEKVLNQDEDLIMLFSAFTANPKVEPLYRYGMLTIDLGYAKGDLKPRPLHIEFGRDRGQENLNRDVRSADYGLIRLNEGATFARLAQVPYFNGEEKYLGIDLRFPVLAADVDLEKLSIAGLDMRVYKPALGFVLEHPKVNAKFAAGLNGQIESAKKKLEQTGGTSLLAKIFGTDCSEALKEGPR